MNSIHVAVSWGFICINTPSPDIKKYGYICVNVYPAISVSRPRTTSVCAPLPFLWWALEHTTAIDLAHAWPKLSHVAHVSHVLLSESDWVMWPAWSSVTCLQTLPPGLESSDKVLVNLFRPGKRDLYLSCMHWIFFLLNELQLLVSWGFVSPHTIGLYEEVWF